VPADQPSIRGTFWVRSQAVLQVVLEMTRWSSGSSNWRADAVGMRSRAMRRPNPAVNGGLERAIAGAAVTEPVLLAALGGLNLGAAFYVRKSAAQGEP
jgi:hypothetical protein